VRKLTVNSERFESLGRGAVLATVELGRPSQQSEKRLLELFGE